MAERYSRVYSLPSRQYASGSPVILEAGALLKDHKTGKMLAQLKFSSVSEQPIKLLGVAVQPLDAMGRALGEPVSHQYLDLLVRRDEEFGSNQAISLPDDAARAFTVSILETGYGDNTVSGAVSAPWLPLEEPTKLEAALDNAELVKQFRLTYGADCTHQAARQQDMWCCTCGALNHSREEKCHRCARPFLALSDADMQALHTAMEERLAEEKHQAELAEEKRKAEEAEAERIRKIEAEKAAAQQKKAIRIIALVVAAAAVVAAAFLLVTKVVIPNRNYNAAVALMDAGQYEEAIAAFEAMEGYKDSADKILECRYNAAIVLKDEGKYEEAIAAFEAMNDYKDSADMIAECKYDAAIILKDEGKYEKAIAASEAMNDYKDSADMIAECKYDAAIILQESAPASAAIAFSKSGSYQDAASRSKQLWDHVAERATVSAGYYYTAGLRADGTVVAVGDNKNSQCDVSGWKDIVAVSAGLYHTVGLKADGTVVAVGDNKNSQCDVSGWKDIVAVSAGYSHTVGLRADGTVVAVGYNYDGQCDVSGWKDIVAVSAGPHRTAGLRADGTVVAVGDNYYGQCDVSGWKDIVAVSAGDWHTVGLRADGTVVAVGSNGYGKYNVSGWKDIKLP